MILMFSFTTLLVLIAVLLKIHVHLHVALSLNGRFPHSEGAAFLRNIGGYSSTKTASHLEDPMPEIIP
jgi:hypothetical protein